MISSFPSVPKLMFLDNLLINNYLHIQIAPFVDVNQNSIIDSNEYTSNLNTVHIHPSNTMQISSTNSNHLYLDVTQDFNVILI